MLAERNTDKHYQQAIAAAAATTATVTQWQGGRLSMPLP